MLLQNWLTSRGRCGGRVHLCKRACSVLHAAVTHFQEINDFGSEEKLEISLRILNI